MSDFRIVYKNGACSFDISEVVAAYLKGSQAAKESDTMMRFRKVVGDAVKTHIAKAHGNPASQQRPMTQPPVAKPSNTPTTNGPPPMPQDWTPAAYERAVVLLMEQNGLSRDQAESMIYRASKAFTDPKPQYASNEPVAAVSDESADKKFARLQKRYPNLSADELHTIAHREERMRKLGF